MSSRALAFVCLVLVAAPARAEGPRRVAVLTPQHAADDRLACAALVLADGLTEALAGGAGVVLLDRALVRTLEREGTPTGAESEIRFALSATPKGLSLRVSQPPALAATPFEGADAAQLLPQLARAVAAELGAASPREPVAFPSGEACAHLARAWAAFAPGDPAALARARSELTAALLSAPEDARVLAALSEVETRSGAARGVALAEKAVAAAPELAEARWALGLAHDQAGQRAAALAAYREAMARSAGVLAARVNAGLIELGEKRLAPALELLEGAAARAPSWFVAQFDLAVAYVEASDGRGALTLLERLHAPAASGERALLEAAAQLLAGDAARAAELVRPLATHAALGLRARALLARAAALANAGEGLAALEAALAETPAGAVYERQRQSLIVARARALAATGRKDEALRQLAELVAADADMARPLLHRALVTLGGAGKEVLERLVQHDANDHESWFDLGVACEAAGDAKCAGDAYEHAAQANPRAVWALYNRGLLALAGGDARGAVSFLEAAQKVAGDKDIDAALEAARARL